MSTPINDGGPAFPRPGISTNWAENLIGPKVLAHTGMTLRDYLAGQALAGILVNYTTQDFDASEFTVGTAAYQYADTMLAARKEVQP